MFVLSPLTTLSLPSPPKHKSKHVITVFSSNKNASLPLPSPKSKWSVKDGILVQKCNCFFDQLVKTFTQHLKQIL